MVINTNCRKSNIEIQSNQQQEMTVFALMTIMRMHPLQYNLAETPKLKPSFLNGHFLRSLEVDLRGALCCRPPLLLLKVVPLLPTCRIAEVIAPTVLDNVLGDLLPRDFAVVGIHTVGQLADSSFQ